MLLTDMVLERGLEETSSLSFIRIKGQKARRGWVTYKEGLSGSTSFRALVPLACQVVISRNALSRGIGSRSGGNVLLLFLLSGGRHCEASCEGESKGGAPAGGPISGRRLRSVALAWKYSSGDGWIRVLGVVRLECLAHYR
jgi:hypothetical protein